MMESVKNGRWRMKCRTEGGFWAHGNGGSNKVELVLGEMGDEYLKRVKEGKVTQ